MTLHKIIGAATLTLLLSAGVAAAQTTYPTTNTGSDQTGSMTGTTMSDQSSASSSGSGTGMTGAGAGTTGGTSGTSGTGSRVPGTPNTGAGGDMATNGLLLGSSALIAIAGIAYLATRRSSIAQ